MIRHLLVFLLLVVSTALLIGCGGSGSNERRLGTTDNRILGDWVAREIRFAGQTQTCPGEIASGDDTVSCSNAVSRFSANGDLHTGSFHEQYFFNGETLTVYGRDNQTGNFGVVFENDNTMRWTFNQDGRNVVLILDRVVLD